MSKNEIGSLVDLEKTISNIGADIKFLFEGVRENWWKLKNIVIINDTPVLPPSSYLKYKDSKTFCADDKSPFFCLSTISNCLYLWNPNKSIWVLLNNNYEDVVEIKEDEIILSPLYRCLKKEINSLSKIKFNLNELSNKNKFYSFKIILDIKNNASSSCTFLDQIIWDKDEVPTFSSGKIYFITINVLNKKIYGKIDFKGKN